MQLDPSASQRQVNEMRLSNGQRIRSARRRTGVRPPRDRIVATLFVGARQYPHPTDSMKVPRKVNHENGRIFFYASAITASKQARCSNRFRLPMLTTGDTFAVLDGGVIGSASDTPSFVWSLVAPGGSVADPRR